MPKCVFLLLTINVLFITKVDFFIVEIVCCDFWCIAGSYAVASLEFSNSVLPRSGKI